MLLEEWNMEDVKKVWREEALEEGIEKGRNESRFEERRRFFKLLDQGFSAEEIKRQLSLENYHD